MKEVKKLMNLTNLIAELGKAGEQVEARKQRLEREQGIFDAKFEEIRELVLSLGEEDRLIASQESTTCAKILEAENG